MAGRRSRRKKSPQQPDRASGRSRRGRSRLWPFLTFVGGVITLLGLLAVGLWNWANRTRSPDRVGVVVVAAEIGRFELSERLQRQGAVSKPLLFAGYWLLFHPGSRIEPGVHALPANVSMRELLDVLARKTSRPKVKVTLPEGQNSFQMASVLAAHAVCPEQSFLALVHSEAFARSVGVPAASLEGYLFPDTYELYVNSTPSAVLERLVAAAQQHYGKLIDEHAEEFDALGQHFGFQLHQVVTLASMVEKEAGDVSEDPIIASVFFNRLSDEAFKPRQMLQSDPTAGYGCLRDPAVPSCDNYTGRITPQMLRDEQNPYNTYRHAGLPPGPISNPGTSALLGVLKPATTPYLFFVANGHGKHLFTRTLAEHEAAIEGGL